MIEFHLPGQLPSGKNAVQVTRTGRRYPGDRFKNWRDQMFLMMAAQRVPRPFLAEPLLMHVDYIPGDKRRRDVPGIMDAILHLIEKWGVVADDKWIVDVNWKTWHADWEPKKDGPRTPGAWVRIYTALQQHTPKDQPPSHPLAVRTARGRKSGSR